MRIPYLSLPIRKLCKRSVADPSQLIFVPGWIESEVFPKILLRLRMVSDRFGLAFDDFEQFCAGLDETSRRRALVFSPFDEPALLLARDDLLAHVAPTVASLLPSSSGVLCRLNVGFQGVFAYRLAQHFRQIDPTLRSMTSPPRRSTTPSHASSSPSVPAYVFSDRTLVSPVPLVPQATLCRLMTLDLGLGMGLGIRVVMCLSQPWVVLMMMPQPLPMLLLLMMLMLRMLPTHSATLLLLLLLRLVTLSIEFYPQSFFAT